ncbi:right-handed parallel beta-helix repeat-containing protein [Micromonospora sp. NPDC005161]
MSTYRGGDRSARPRRRSRWFLAGGFLAGSLVVGAAGVAGVAAAADRDVSVPGLGRLTAASRDDDRTAPEREEGRDGAEPARPDTPGTGKRGVVSVPCDAAKLVAALVAANAEGGAELRLAPKCRYTLTEAFHETDQYDGGIRDARETADAAEIPGDADAPPHNPADDTAGLPVIYQPITIDGAGATIARDAQAAAFRFFTVRDGGELTLRDVELHNGRSAIEGGSVHVVHGATAVVERVTVTQSTSLSPEGGGGGIFNDGNMVVTDSTFIGNSASGAAGKGGGLLNGGVLTLKRSEFHRNSANGYGGGLGNYRGAAEVESTTFAQNSASQGGGLASFSARTKVSDTELLNNTAQIGGGAANSDAVLMMRRMTIRGNTSTVNGGGISTVQGLLPLDDSVVDGNTTHGIGAGIYAAKSNLLVRGSDVTANEAVGATSMGGGVYATQGSVAIYTSKVTRNAATVKPGGIFGERAQVKIDDESVVVENEPTNCEASAVPIAHCFR